MSMILFSTEYDMGLMGHIIKVISESYQENKGHEQNYRQPQFHTDTLISLSRCKSQKDLFK